MNPKHTALKEFKKTCNKALYSSLAAVLCILTVNVSDGQAATAFQGALKSVTITDAAGTNAPPTAVIEYTKAADTYTFDASKSSDSDGTITGYKWDFGDGTKAEGVTATHQFAAEPTATTLTVLDDKGGVAIAQTPIKLYTEIFEIIVDDADSAGFSTVGTWKQSTFDPGYYKTGYKVAPNGTGAAKAKWVITLPTNGSYEVFCHYTAASNRATNAPYSIVNNTTVVASKLVNQTINGGKFFSMGTYTLAKGTLEITLSDLASGYVVADAVKAVYLP